MDNVLTVDVEDWYQTSDFDFPISTWCTFPDRVVDNTLRLLDLFDQYQHKGTFFVLGCVAQEHPQLVREIAARGHEVASHGGWHQMWTRMTLEEIAADARWSKDLLEQLAGCAVQAFRAPSWSLSPQNVRALQALEEVGYRVDSSLQPFRTPLSGFPQAPTEPFHPVIGGVRLELVEVPSTVIRRGPLRIPFAGGLYLRVWPTAILRRLVAWHNQTAPAMVYVHPWEVDPRQPRLPCSPLVRFAHYHGLQRTEDRLHALLAASRFIRLCDWVATHSFPDVSIGGRQDSTASAGN
ncbi:MAG: polysaccharide deacetylase family protein [Alicyclobacillus sp.]|nr:polysaccharide deacetylase family protein [Alicyclobacillus sp.]